MHQNNATNQPASMRIVKLIAQETGSYNPAYSRPYTSHITPADLESIQQRVELATPAGISPTVFAGISSNILKPSATPEREVPIPYGWTERRIRFILEVEELTTIGTVLIHYVQGYTNYLGITNSGNVDPNMEFIINSITTINRVQQVVPGIGLTLVDRIADSAHILNGNILRTGSDNNSLYGIRPQDVFSGIQVGHLKNGYSEFMGNSRNNIVDTRAQFTGTSVSSNRNNLIPTNFLSTLVDDFQYACGLAQFGQSEEQIYDRARAIAFQKDLDMTQNKFLRAISSIRGYNNNNSFTMKELVAIDSNIYNVFKYIALTQTIKATLHQAGQTSYWNGTDRETLIATILSNVVPALMMEQLFTKLVFRSTNSDMSGKPNTIFIDGKSLTNIDPTNNYYMFKRRFEEEVMFDITYGNQDTYMLEMHSDMFGETRITISINGGSPITYTTPSFCDSLNTPVVTANANNFHQLAHDMDTMFNYIDSDKGLLGKGYKNQLNPLV